MVLALPCMNHLANFANLLFTQELLLDSGMQLVMRNLQIVVESVQADSNIH
jgi:hypothetical protein